MKYIVQKWTEEYGWILYGGVLYSHPQGAVDEADRLNSTYNPKFRAVGFVTLS